MTQGLWLLSPLAVWQLRVLMKRPDMNQGLKSEALYRADWWNRSKELCCGDGRMAAPESTLLVREGCRYASRHLRLLRFFLGLYVNLYKDCLEFEAR